MRATEFDGVRARSLMEAERKAQEESQRQETTWQRELGRRFSVMEADKVRTLTSTVDF